MIRIKEVIQKKEKNIKGDDRLKYKGISKRIRRMKTAVKTWMKIRKERIMRNWLKVSFRDQSKTDGKTPPPRIHQASPSAQTFCISQKITNMYLSF